MAVIHLVRLENVPIFRQLQLEEALLRGSNANWCLLNDGSSEAIVMGISGQIEKLIDPLEYSKFSVPIIRRFSGGGTVYVDHNTCFVTMICNKSCTAVSPYPDQVMKWNAELYHSILKKHGFSLRENDYVLNDRKCGGNAQYLSKNRWLHHSSLLYDFHSHKMNILKIPPKMPAYRDLRGHDQFLCSLKSVGISKKMFFDSYVESLYQKFNVIETDQSKAEQFLNTPHRKTTTFVSFQTSSCN